MLSLLHNEMHNESFLYSSMMLNLPKPKILENVVTITNNIIPITLISINCYKFSQGTDKDIYNFTFDNEMPSHFKMVNDFQISKYPITQSQYLEFVNASGYSSKKHWSQQGWRWITKNKIKHPLYWKKVKDNSC